MGRILHSSLAKGTHSNYKSSISNYIEFCNTNQISPSLRFPADEYTPSKAGGTAASTISGLKAWHHIHGLTWKENWRLGYILRVINVLTPASSQQDLRPPVTLQLLTIIHNKLNLADPFDLAIFAATTTAFWGQCRLGELLGTSRACHDPHCFPSHLSLKHVASKAGSQTLHLPQTKTNQFCGQPIILTCQSRILDPISALNRHLSQKKHIPHHSHLFAHRFRIRGTSQLLATGVSTDVIKAMGQWKSDAFLGYWRNLQIIAPAHAENIHQK
ncbi:hypothetical protein BDV93DRAFT_534713 [Ceratobasidium sp. AG-I]|nr:hypothetical protein BDV93DRAFT_534713 [Ceratobasidium sp. AG-I]